MRIKKKRLHKASWYVTWAIIILIFAGGVTAGLLLPPFWKIKMINISGTNRLEKETVLEIAKPAINKNIFLADVGKIYAEIKKLPLVQDVLIHRLFPDGLAIGIIEKKEAAVAVIMEKTIFFDNQGFVLNPDGKPFKHAEDSEFTRLPVVVGLKDEDVAGGALEEKVKNLLIAVLKDFNKILGKENIKIDLSRKDEIILLVDDFLSVKIGEPAEIERKMAVFQKLREFEQKRIHSIEYIDVRVPDDPVIKFK